MLKEAVREVFQEMMQVPSSSTMLHNYNYMPTYQLPMMHFCHSTFVQPATLPFPPIINYPPEAPSLIRNECRITLNSIISQIENNNKEHVHVAATPSLGSDTPAFETVKSTNKHKRDDRPFELAMDANPPNGFTTLIEAKETLQKICSDSGFCVKVGTSTRKTDKNWFKNFQCCDNGKGDKNRLCPVRYRIFFVKSTGNFIIQKKQGAQVAHNHPPSKDMKKRGLPGWLTRQMDEVIDNSELLGNKVEPDQMRKLILKQNLYNSDIVDQNHKRLLDQVSNSIGYYIHNRTQRLIDAMGRKDTVPAMHMLVKSEKLLIIE